jgi:hypothetical protein
VNPTELAARLDTAVHTLTTADRTMSALSMPARAFGADDAGVPGRMGRDLHARWEAALAARSREAAQTAARLTDLAASLRTTHQQYGETDETVARRIERGAS